jgi:hypothetical protein
MGEVDLPYARIANYAIHRALGITALTRLAQEETLRETMRPIRLVQRKLRSGKERTRRKKP